MLKNKWRLDVLLGVGGMAAVYAATHDTSYGDRRAMVEDRWGNVWQIATVRQDGD
jgi:uncharacterized glyoxalase superfamily protein PhnB